MSFLTFVGGMAKKVNEIKAEERAFEKDLMLQTAKIKTEAEYDPDEMLDYTISWDYTDAKGKPQKETLTFLGGDPRNATIFKDENDRINTAQNGINAIDSFSKESNEAIIKALTDPTDANHESALKLQGIYDLLGHKKVVSKPNGKGGNVFTSSQIIGGPTDIRSAYLGKHDQRVLGVGKMNSAGDILN